MLKKVTRVEQVWGCKCMQPVPAPEWGIGHVQENCSSPTAETERAAQPDRSSVAWAPLCRETRRQG